MDKTQASVEQKKKQELQEINQSLLLFRVLVTVYRVMTLHN